MFQPSANLESTTIIPTHSVKFKCTQAPWNWLPKTLLRTISKLRRRKKILSVPVFALHKTGKRQFHVVFVKWRVSRVFVSFIKPIAFLTLSLLSPSPLIVELNVFPRSFLVVLGGDFRWTWNWRSRWLHRRLRCSARENQCLLQRGHGWDVLKTIKFYLTYLKTSRRMSQNSNKQKKNK